MSEVKAANHVPPDLASCHTALVNGYVIEGHVPADVISKLLAERPAGVKGLAVAGMPMGSPGMEGDGSRKDHYTVMAFGIDGSARVTRLADRRHMTTRLAGAALAGACLVWASAGCRQSPAAATRTPSDPQAMSATNAPDQHDEHSHANPWEVRVTHVALDLVADFQAHVLAGTATLSLEAMPAATAVVGGHERPHDRTRHQCGRHAAPAHGGPRGPDSGPGAAYRPSDRPPCCRHHLSHQSTGGRAAVAGSVPDRRRASSRTCSRRVNRS